MRLARTHFTEIEEAILGALMIEVCYGRVAHVLRPENFSSKKHQLIYTTISNMFPTSRIDILTVTQQLRNTGLLEDAGGPWYITQLTNRVASAANIECHALILLQTDIRFKYIDLLQSLLTNNNFALDKTIADVVETLYESSTDIFDCLEFSIELFTEKGMDEASLQSLVAFNKAVDVRTTRIFAQRVQVDTILTHLAQLGRSQYDKDTAIAINELATCITDLWVRQRCPQPVLQQILTLAKTIATTK